MGLDLTPREALFMEEVTEPHSVVALPTLSPPQAARSRTEGFHREMPNVFTPQEPLSAANISPAPPHCGEGEEEEEEEQVVEEGLLPFLWDILSSAGKCKGQRHHVRGG